MIMRRNMLGLDGLTGMGLTTPLVTEDDYTCGSIAPSPEPSEHDAAVTPSDDEDIIDMAPEDEEDRDEAIAEARADATAAVEEGKTLDMQVSSYIEPLDASLRRLWDGFRASVGAFDNVRRVPVGRHVLSSLDSIERLLVIPEFLAEGYIKCDEILEGYDYEHAYRTVSQRMGPGMGLKRDRSAPRLANEQFTEAARCIREFGRLA